MGVKIGFTGTQKGLTPQQREVLTRFFSKTFNITSAHHGDCIGADEEFHVFCLACNIPIHIHPPENPYKRAFCTEHTCLHLPKSYLERNHDIVDATDILIACPKNSQEDRRSGTWATIRYANKQCKPIYIITPEGEVL